MKKPFKVLRIVLLLVVILVIAAVVGIGLFAESILKRGIEGSASKTLGVKVSVEDVDLSIFGGKVSLKNLVINNPERYEHKRLLELEDGRIAVAVRTLLGDPVNIREIKLDGMEVVLEQRGVSSNNLQDVIRSIPEKDEGAEAKGKKLHIDILEISNVTVKVKALPIPGKVDLGSDNKLDAAVLAGKILLALAQGIAEQGIGVLPKEIINPLKGELNRFGKLPEVLLEEAGNILKEGKGLEKGIGNGLKGLFEKKEKK